MLLSDLYYRNAAATLWPLPVSILHEDVGHQDTIGCLAFSPDDSCILSGSWDGTAKLWEVATGRLVHTLGWGSAQINAVDWSPDGAVIAVAGERPPVQLSDDQLERYQAYFDRRDTSFFDTYDNSAEPDDDTRLFDACTGALLRIIPDSGRGVAFAPDGQTIAVASWTLVSIVNLSDGSRLSRFCDSHADFRNLFYSADGLRLICVDSDGVRVLDGRSAELVFIARDRCLFSDAETDVAGSIVHELTGVPDHLEPEQEPAYALKFWQDVLTGFQPHVVSDGGIGLRRIAFAPNGIRAVFPAGNTLIMLRADTHEVEWRVDHTGGLRTVAFSRDGRLLAGAGDDGRVTLWNAETGREVSRIGVPPAEVACVAFSPSHPYLAAGTKDGSVFLCDFREPSVLAVGDSLGTTLKHLDFSPATNLLLAACSDGTVRILGLPALDVILELRAHAGRLIGAAFSADGARFITVGYTVQPTRPLGPEAHAQIITWSSSGGAVLDSQTLPDGLYLTSVQLSADRSRLAMAADRVLLFADITANKVRIQRASLPENRRAFRVAFCDSRRILVTDDGYRMKVLNLADGGEQQSFSATRDGATALVVSPDGRMLARSTAYFHEIELFDLATGKLKRYCLGHQNAVGSLAISGDGGVLASGGRDGALKLWNLPSGRLTASIVLSRQSDSSGRPEWKRT